MATVSTVRLTSRVLGRKIKKFGTFFVKMNFWVSGGEGYCPSAQWLRLAVGNNVSD